tara:strand:+ start:68 stop:490 length:423 start_codon:yes stop_codon:yes gene_type:complete
MRRFAAIFYDILLLVAVLFLATAILLPITGGKAINNGNMLYFLYLLSCCYIYFSWQWTHGGQTLGMRSWKIRLVDKHGLSVNWVTVNKRFLLASISWLTGGAGFIWSVFDLEKLAFHDRYSHTKLIHEPSRKIGTDKSPD